MLKKLSYQIAAFVIIGSVGFIIDGGVLTYLSVGLGVNVYGSRLISFTLASLTTWLLNRKYTFRRSYDSPEFSRRREYGRYIIIQTGGALINLGVFTWVVAANPALLAIPIIPCAFGAGVALFFNFIGARMWVFKENTLRLTMRFSWIVGILILFRIIVYIYFVGLEGDYLAEDSPIYLQLADNLREYHVFSKSGEPPFSPEIFRTPGYPIFLAFIHALGMASTYWATFWQEIIYGLSIFIFYRYGKPFFGEKLARIGVIFLLLEPGGFSEPKIILSETLFLPFFFGGLFAIGYYLKSTNWRYLALSGVLMGAAVYIRPANLYLPAVAALTLVIFDYRSTKRWLHTAVLLIAVSVVITPWLLRNYYYYGKLVMSSSQSVLLAEYHVPFVWESAKDTPFLMGQEIIRSEIKQAVEEQARTLQRPLNTAEISDLEQRLALNELKKYPWDYFKQWSYGFLKAMSGGNLFDIYHSFKYRVDRLHFFQIEATDIKEQVFTFLINQDYFYIFEVLLRVFIAFFALCGTVFILAKKDCFFWVMMLANFYFICIPGPMGLPRYRFPVEIFWFIQAYVGFWGVLTLITNRSRNNRAFSSDVQH